MGALTKFICLLPLAVCSEPRGWEFMQSVGGLALGEPIREGEEWLLPVRVNVSGLETITTKPTTVNSALICESVSSVVNGNSIYVTVNVGVAREGYFVVCPPAHLGKLKEGTYSIFYQGPQEGPQALGEAKIGSNQSLSPTPESASPLHAAAAARAS